MDVVGELIESVRVRTATPKPRAMAARRAFATAHRAQLPWLLALLPLGSLVAAGLLVILLSRFVAVSPTPPAPDVSAVDVVEPAATPLDGNDDWSVTFEPM